MDAGTFRSVKEGYCALCYAKAKDKCGKCKLPYCSPFCQQKDWYLGHKGDCGLSDLPAPRAVPSPEPLLLVESVQRPIISEAAWRSLVEATETRPRPGPPRGLLNLGNTCYLNSVLQGLYHSAPVLLAACREHRQGAAASGAMSTSFCADLEATMAKCLDPRPPAEESRPFEFLRGDRVVLRNLKNSDHLNGQEAIVTKLPSDGSVKEGSLGVQLAASGKVVSCPQDNVAFGCRESVGPRELVRWLSKLGEFNYGTQEDAHELLRSVLRLIEDEEVHSLAETLRRSPRCEASDVRPENNAEITGAACRLFRGLLVSSVQCTNRTCGECKFSFEAFMDLALDITEATDTVEDALRLFTAAERLDKQNGWRCESCEQVVRARKQMTIYSAPRVLVLQLKRFRYVETGARNKVNKEVSFEASLNLRPFLWKHTAGGAEAGKPLMYELRAIVIHLDRAGFSHFGHYITYVRRQPIDGAPGAPSRWYLLDDGQATEVPEETVLRQQAYLLFYARAGEAVELPRRLGRVATVGEQADASQPGKCRGRGGAVCSFFARCEGLCTRCYQEEYGRPPPSDASPSASTSGGGSAPGPGAGAPGAASGGYPAGSAGKEVPPAPPKAKAAPPPPPPAPPPASSSKAKKVGANDKCPCGSGLKYKKCHGK